MFFKIHFNKERLLLITAPVTGDSDSYVRKCFPLPCELATTWVERLKFGSN